MRTRRILASALLLAWLGIALFVGGPVRWEVAHTYGHLIEGAVGDLPTLARAVALPFLGVGESSFGSTVVCWTVLAWAWLGPVALIACVCRARSGEAVSDCLLFGGAAYWSILLAVLAVMAVSLWLPFALL